MASEWPVVSLADIASPEPGGIAIGPFGSRMKSDCYVADGVRVVRGNNLTGGRTFKEDFVFVTLEKAGSLGNSLLKPRDLVFPHRGSIGEVGIIPCDGHSYVMSTSLMKLTCDLSKVIPDFVYYFFKSAAGRHALLSNQSQVGTPGIGQPLTSLKSIQIAVPPISDQGAIVSIMVALDDRIESLRCCNVTTEGIAQAIFKSWFVDFDPVRAKAEGREPEGMDAATAALFPSGFQELELGSIPSGWQIEGFDSAVVITSGGTPKTSRPDYWGGDIPWFSIVDAPSSSDVFVIETEKRITDEGLASCAARLLPVGATIISARGTVGKVAMTGTPMAINQSCYALLPKVFGNYGTFFQTGLLVDVLRQRAHGAVFSTITRDTLSSIRIASPPRVVAEKYEETVGAMMGAILNNRNMSKALAELRDTLLPRLITGKLRVPEAENFVEAAL